MAIARITDVCGLVKARIEGLLPGGDTTAVSREYRPAVTDLTDDELAALPGRYCWVMPASYGQADGLTRGTDLNVFTVAVVVAERYAAAGRPPTLWLDENVDWVNEQVYAVLTSTDGRQYPAPDDDLIADTCEVTTVFDKDALSQLKMFWSVVAVTYRVES